MKEVTKTMDLFQRGMIDEMRGGGKRDEGMETRHLSTRRVSHDMTNPDYKPFHDRCTNSSELLPLAQSYLQS